MSSNLSALVGGIVFTWWPDDQNPALPGPKFRPAYVMDIDFANNRALLAYGTSQRQESCRCGEIMIRRAEMKRLKSDTKFRLNKAKWLPLTPEYFSQSKTGSDVVYFGTPPAARADDLLIAASEAGIRLE